jgi:GDPmannose 4,6-dehydratase
VFGQPKEMPQNEMLALFHRSPYAVSKLADIWKVRTYKEAYKLFMAYGILFNHESEVLGP